MIAVETKPVRLQAVQWNGPQDAPELTAQYLCMGLKRWGCHNMERGFQTLMEGHWIVVGEEGSRWPRTYTNSAFHQKFKVIEEGQHA